MNGRGPKCGFCSGLLTPHWNRAGMVRCRSCGLLLREDMPGAEALACLYRTGWRSPEEHSSETGGTTLALSRIYFARLASSLHLKTFAGLNILDFGAGSGATSSALGELGAEVSAVEPFGFDYLKTRGHRVFRSIDEIPRSESFDGIVSVDVMEHLEEPWETLARLRGRLKRSGWMFLSTPNSDGLSARLLRAKWREAGKPGHTVLFNPRSLERVLRHAGFGGVRRLRWLLDYGRGPVRALQNYSFQLLGLEGELRYLAFHGRGSTAQSETATQTV